MKCMNRSWWAAVGKHSYEEFVDLTTTPSGVGGCTEMIGRLIKILPPPTRAILFVLSGWLPIRKWFNQRIHLKYIGIPNMI